MPTHVGGVLVVGGCGTVGHLVGPRLGRIHGAHLYNLELRECEDDACPWINPIVGDVTDIGDVFLATRAKDAILFSAMGNLHDPQSLFEVGVRGWYNCLLAAKELGVGRVVLVSSMSVYDDYHSVVTESEDRPVVSDDPYGVVKILAEQLGRHFAETYGMSVIALRISQPMPDLETIRGRRVSEWATSDRKLAEAFSAALSLKDHVGFDAIHVCGSKDFPKLNLEKAKRLLGWEPA